MLWFFLAVLAAAVVAAIFTLATEPAAGTTHAFAIY